MSSPSVPPQYAEILARLEANTATAEDWARLPEDVLNRLPLAIRQNRPAEPAQHSAEAGEAAEAQGAAEETPTSGDLQGDLESPDELTIYEDQHNDDMDIDGDEDENVDSDWALTLYDPNSQLTGGFDDVDMTTPPPPSPTISMASNEMMAIVSRAGCQSAHRSNPVCLWDAPASWATSIMARYYIWASQRTGNGNSVHVIQFNAHRALRGDAFGNGQSRLTIDDGY